MRMRNIVFGAAPLSGLLAGTAYAADGNIDLQQSDITTNPLVKRSTGEDLGRLAVSAGVAPWSNCDVASTLINRADECLCAAKRAGRNRVIVQADQLVPHSAYAGVAA